jgi:hypothetical protein
MQKVALHPRVLVVPMSSIQIWQCTGHLVTKYELPIEEEISLKSTRGHWAKLN